MRWTGMPMAMWVLFAGSFQKQLTAVLGYDTDTARKIPIINYSKRFGSHFD